MLSCVTCHVERETKRARKCADGQFRCKSCSHKHRLLKYNHSTKGKLAYQRHSKTDTFKKTQRKYATSEKGAAKKNEIAKRHYWADPDYQRLKALSRVHGVEPALLQQVRERDKVCKSCSSDQNLTFDHIVPVSKGGKASMENLQILCNSCNASKGNR